MSRARRAPDGLDEDIRDHIERETQENLDRGMAPEEARRQAMLKFGTVALAKEATRAVWGWQWLEQLVQDSRYAVRTLRRQHARTEPWRVLLRRSRLPAAIANRSRHVSGKAGPSRGIDEIRVDAAHAALT
jgi:hypothetical protein